MIHYMKLTPSAFESIKCKTKTIEMRLNDEKRQKIQKGDIICFENIETKESLTVTVLNLYHFKNFSELYQAFDKRSLGYQENEAAAPEDMVAYYSLEQIEKYGVLAIELVA